MTKRKNIALITCIYRDEDLGIFNQFKKDNNKFRIYKVDCRNNNEGYAHGINMGIVNANKEKSEIYIISNIDIDITNIDVLKILEGLKHFDILGFAMKQNGQMYYGGTIDKNRLSGGLNSQKPTKQYAPVDFVSGSFMVVTKKVIDTIGYLNEKYFMYYEDVEYCYLAKKHGLKVGIDSKNYYTHFEASKNNPDKARYLFQNRFIFFMKFSNLKQKIREFFRLPKTIIEHLPLLLSTVQTSSFATNFFSHNISSILSKVAHFFIFIVLIRTLSPSQYGIYTVVWAFVNMFTPFLDFGTTTYGLVHGKKENTDIKIMFSLRLYLSLAVYLAIIFGSLLAFKDASMKVFILLTATTVFSSSISGSYLILNSLREKVYISSWLNLGFNIIFSIIVISALLFKQGIVYLFTSYAVCYIAFALLNALLIREYLTTRINLRKWLITLKQSFIFVVIGFLAGLYFKADVFFLKYFYGDRVVGIYSAGTKFLDTLLIIPGSYNIVVIPIMRRLAGNLSSLKIKAIKDGFFLLGLGLLVTLAFYLLSPFVLPILLKKSFNNSLEIARIVAFAIVPILLTSVCYNSLYALKKERYVLYTVAAKTVISILVLAIFVPRLPINGTAYIKIFVEFFDVALSFILLKYALHNA